MLQPRSSYWTMTLNFTLFWLWSSLLYSFQMRTFTLFGSLVCRLLKRISRQYFSRLQVRILFLFYVLFRLFIPSKLLSLCRILGPFLGIHMFVAHHGSKRSDSVCFDDAKIFFCVYIMLICRVFFSSNSCWNFFVSGLVLVWCFISVRHL